MQATADVTKKESSWSSWKGQGTDVFTVILPISRLCFVAVRDRMLPLHVASIFIKLEVCSQCVCVCVPAFHLSFNHIYYVLGNQNKCVYLYLRSHGHALMTDPLGCVCVSGKKNKERG